MNKKLKESIDKSEKPISPSLERDNIEKRYPNLKILDVTEEMTGKTSLYTWIQPLTDPINLRKKPNNVGRYLFHCGVLK